MHPSHIPLQLGYRCGMRLGEVFGLTWEDIDFDNKTLNINKQVQMINGHWTFTDPKYNSKRCIAIDETLCSLLIKEKNRAEKAKLYYDSYYSYIYVNDECQLNSKNGKIVNMIMAREDGTYIQPRTLQNVGRIVHYKLNLPEWDFHSLRHTHTTMLIEAGVDPVTVQKRLGHKNIETTLGIYTSCTKKMEQNVASKLDEILR